MIIKVIELSVMTKEYKGSCQLLDKKDGGIALLVA